MRVFFVGFLFAIAFCDKKFSMLKRKKKKNFIGPTVGIDSSTRLVLTSCSLAIKPPTCLKSLTINPTSPPNGGRIEINQHVNLALSLNKCRYIEMKVYYPHLLPPTRLRPCLLGSVHVLLSPQCDALSSAHHLLQTAALDLWAGL